MTQIAEPPRLTGSSLHQVLARLYSQLPQSRRTRLRCPGAWKVGIRNLLRPILRRPVVVRTPQGLRLFVSNDPVDERIVSSLLGRHRRDFLPEDFDLPPAPMVLDVGAHHGYYALFALAAYPGARIVCVEPMKRAAEWIRRNLALNGWQDRAVIVEAALAAGSGHGVLLLAADGSWGHSLFSPATETIGSQTVRTATLDEILGDTRPDIVKCNAEGAEFELVRQLADADLRPRLLAIAVHDWVGPTTSIVDRLSDLGYHWREVGLPKRPVLHFWIPGLLRAS